MTLVVSDSGAVTVRTYFSTNGPGCLRMLRWTPCLILVGVTFLTCVVRVLFPVRASAVPLLVPRWTVLVPVWDPVSIVLVPVRNVILCVPTIVVCPVVIAVLLRIVTRFF